MFGQHLSWCRDVVENKIGQVCFVPLESIFQCEETMLVGVAQSCLTLCDPMDCSPRGSSLSKGFSRQEDWNGLPFHPPGDLPDPGIKPRSPAFQAYSLPVEAPGKSINSSEALESHVFMSWNLLFWSLFFPTFPQSPVSTRMMRGWG